MKRGALFGFIICLCACAKVVPPDGGDVDKTPPNLILVSPPNYTTNFQSETIYLEFDEFVQLSDVYNQLVVSPPLEQRPEIRIKKKGVILELKELLKSNTTYTFNFGSGIGDLTENNSAEELVYVISTGDVLDSLRVDGLVRDAFTNEAVEGAKVMLYQSNEDSLPKTTKPFYFGLTKADGSFSIQNMAQGNYKTFILKEANNNYLFDDPATESI
ncbi:MAG: Ig-like domain-containing protein, partial [Bacteroidota bacterium]